MKILNFNNDWRYSRLDENNFKKITIPHDAMIYEERSMASKGGKHISWFLAYDYKYEKKFTVNNEDIEKKFILEFEGVYQNASIYLNNQKIHHRPYGYTNFYVDLTDKLNFNDSNTITVIVKNKDQPNSRWYSGAGIYRPVNLYVLPKEHILINGIKIKTIDLSERIINLDIKTNTKGILKVEFFYDKHLIDKYTFNTDGNFNKNISLKGTKIWDIDNPNLYDCVVTFNDQNTQKVRFGIRTIDVNSNDGFKLNDKRVILRGACIHHDNGLLGAEAHPFAEKRKIKILLEAGYNAIRSAHNPCSKSLLDACDELGMLVLDEYSDMWYIHKNPYDYAGKMEQWWKKDLKDMVDKNFNHPSVIMYSIGNEVAETSEKRGIDLTEEMTVYLKELDYRPVTCGINIFFNYLYSLGFGVYSDKKAKRNIDKPKKHKAVGSEFFNNLAGLLGDKTMKIGAWLRGSDRKTKDAFSKLDIAGYNYGIYRYKKDLKKYPNRIILGSETFCSDTHKFYELAKKNNRLIGDFVWAGMDYLGEVGIGSWVYQDRTKDFSHGVGWMTAGSGRIDINGIMSSETSYTRVAYDLDDIRIGVVPVNNYGKKHSPSAWKMNNAVESWSWEGFEGKKTSVEVYTKAPLVLLYVNDKLVGKKKNKNSIVKFKTKYQNGTIKAVGYNNNKIKMYETFLKTAGSQTILTIRPEQEIINKDDLCYVHLEFTDQKGKVKPLERGEIKVEVLNGDLLGLGHACPYSEHGYKDNVTDTYLGRAMAIIKPSNNKDITIKANSSYGNKTINIKIK